MHYRSYVNVLIPGLAPFQTCSFLDLLLSRPARFQTSSFLNPGSNNELTLICDVARFYTTQGQIC